MARLTYSLLSFTLILSVLPSALAGPACACRLQSREDCVEACGKKWGWDGMAMGFDRWGAVVGPDKANNLEVVKAKACRVRPSKSPPAAVAGSPPSASSSGENRSSSSETVTPPSPASVNALVTTTSSKSFKARPTSKSLSTSTSKAPAPKASSSPPPPPKTSNPPPKPTPEKPVGGSSGGPSGGEIGQYLDAHNGFRGQHGASPLTWNDGLASKAREWANKCVFKHSGGTLGPFGENLAAGTGDFGIGDAVQGWKDEAPDYDPNNPQASHFTQVVWKGSTQLGCAHADCDGIFDASFGKAKFHVCEYQAAGNVQGQFKQNVQP